MNLWVPNRSRMDQSGNSFIITSGQVLHHDREHALPQTRIHNFLAMLGQVARRAADHYSELIGHDVEAGKAKNRREYTAG